MNICIELPLQTGFDIELDAELIHTKYENVSISVFLAKGQHTLSAIDQAPASSAWQTILGFMDPLSPQSGDFSYDIQFELLQPVDVTVSIKYGDYERVEFIFSHDLSPFITPK